jgi:hypothetical protein
MRNHSFCRSLLSLLLCLVALFGLKSEVGSTPLLDSTSGSNTNSSSVAEFWIEGSGQQIIAGKLLALVRTNVLTIFGTNLIPNASRVLVNGQETILSPAQQHWSKTLSVRPGLNRIIVDILDSTGNLLASTNKPVVFESSAFAVGGLLASNTTWTSSMGIIHITNNIVIPVGGSLSIARGTVILFDGSYSIVGTNAAVTIAGTSVEPILLAPADGESPWNALSVAGSQASLVLKNAEIISGLVDISEGASGLLEDGYLHDYVVGFTPIIQVLSASSFIERRCHVARYFEHSIGLTSALFEDCLFEHVYGDGIDFDGGMPGSIIRRCTVRHGNAPGVDAIDLGAFGAVPTVGVLIEECLIYDFPYDKGVSVGEVCREVVVRNCVIYEVDSAIAVKDSSFVTAYNNTIVDAKVGFNLYEKNPGLRGGHARTFNNVLWNNATVVGATNDSTISIDYSVVAHPLPLGMNNINLDPLFVRPALKDFRLATNSPALGSGLGGTNIGALLPAGSLLTDDDHDKVPDVWELANGLDPFQARDARGDSDADGVTNQQEFIAGTNPQSASSVLKITKVNRPQGKIAFDFMAAPDRTYSVLYRDAAERGSWTKLQDISVSSVGRLVEINDATLKSVPVRFYHIVTPAIP